MQRLSQLPHISLPLPRSFGRPSGAIIHLITTECQELLHLMLELHVPYDTYTVVSRRIAPRSAESGRKPI